MKIEDLPAGRELDRLVGTRVMGDVLTHASHEFIVPGEGGPRRCWRCHRVASRAGPCEVDPPYYSTDIAAAWEVVEAMIRRPQPGTFGTYTPVLGVSEKSAGMILRQQPGEPPPFVSWWCSLSWGMGDDGVESSTAPLAICRAALLAVESESSS